MNHSDKPKEYDQGVFAELIKQGRIKHILRPFSSESVERPVFNRKAGASDTPKGSIIKEAEMTDAEMIKADREMINPQNTETVNSLTWWHYIIVRKELSGGAAMAQGAHAAGYSAARLGAPLPEHTRVCVLSATKEQFGDIYSKLMIRSDTAGKTVYAMYETEGQLAGSYTALGFLTSDKQSIIDVVGHLDLWRNK